MTSSFASYGKAPPETALTQKVTEMPFLAAALVEKFTWPAELVVPVKDSLKVPEKLPETVTPAAAPPRPIEEPFTGKNRVGFLGRPSISNSVDCRQRSSKWAKDLAGDAAPLHRST